MGGLRRAIEPIAPIAETEPEAEGTRAEVEAGVEILNINDMNGIAITGMTVEIEINIKMMIT